MKFIGRLEDLAMEASTTANELSKRPFGEYNKPYSRDEINIKWLLFWIFLGVCGFWAFVIWGVYYLHNI